MSVEIENNNQQLLKRLNKIKKTILDMNPSIEFQNISDVNQHEVKAKYVDESLTSCHPNDTFHIKSNLYELKS